MFATMNAAVYFDANAGEKNTEKIEAIVRCDTQKLIKFFMFRSCKLMESRFRGL